MIEIKEHTLSFGNLSHSDLFSDDHHHHSDLFSDGHHHHSDLFSCDHHRHSDLSCDHHRHSDLSCDHHLFYHRNPGIYLDKHKLDKDTRAIYNKKENKGYINGFPVVRGTVLVSGAIIDTA